MSNLLIPAYFRAHGLMTGTQASQAAAAAFCRIKAEGKIPDSLDVLDPFTGKSMLFTRTDNGFQLLSVGQNLRDDGGEDDDIMLKSPK